MTDDKQISYVGIDDVKPDPNQPRTIFSQGHIDGLATSLKTEGIINPLEVDENLTIITGECRWKAAKQLGWEMVPVIINHTKLPPYERLRHQMAENVHQSGMGYETLMNPIDSARGYAKLFEFRAGRKWKSGHETEANGVIKGIAEEMGISTDTVYDYLGLLEQPEYVIADIEKGRPQTYYREVSRAKEVPDDVKEEFKKKIAGGDYKSRSEVREDLAIVRNNPDLGMLEMERQRAKESAATNKILNSVAKLGLALENLPLGSVDVREKGIVVRQLQWINERIQEYLNV